MDANSFAAGVAAGLVGGAVLTGAVWPAVRRYLARTARPMTLRDTRAAKRFDTVQPGIRRLDHSGQWVTWTRRFIVFAETVGRENGKPDGRLPSLSEMTQASGVTWRHLKPYLTVLQDGGLIEIRGRAGAWWLVDKPTRRVKARSLLYPADERPRRFPFARVTRDVTL